jgi:hypothetical protein
VVTKWTRPGLVLCVLALSPALIAATGETTRDSQNENYSDEVRITQAVVDTAAERITFSGDNFATWRRRTSVYLGFTQLAVISSSDDQVVAQLPAGLAAGTYTFSVANGVDHDSIDVAIGGVGAVGPQGPEGPQGPQGLQGFTGAQGPAGATGATGADGAIGPVGPVGPVGPAGPAGPAGADGAVGPQGPQGQVGPAGPAGPAGVAGADGAVGPQGPQGPAGPAGAAGADGAAGPQGPAGSDGVNGVDGAPGATGPQGPQGAAGPAGPAGPQGGSGFVNVLGYENAVALTLTTAMSTPAACQTTPYVAGANETAIVSVDVTTFTQSFDSLFLAPMFSVNGGAPVFGVSFLTAGPLHSLEYGSLHNQAMIPLTAGSSYRFMTGVRTRLGNVTPDEFSCRGLVTIVRRP